VGALGRQRPRATRSAEERLLLDIVRLRYVDGLPNRDSAHPIFRPSTPEGLLALTQSGSRISKVFRLWLRSLNRVSNADRAGGPTPRTAPDYAEFLVGVTALQRLHDRGKVKLTAIEREDCLTDPLPIGFEGAEPIADLGAGLEYRNGPKGGRVIVRKQRQPALRFEQVEADDPDFAAFCRAFKLNRQHRTFEMTSGKMDPFPEIPPGGFVSLDLEIRSSLEMLFFVAHGVQIPPAHAESGVAPLTSSSEGAVFDWQRVLGGLFKVHWADGEEPPSAPVVVQYREYWFYLDERDRYSQETFNLLVAMMQTGDRTIPTKPN
jgi:hypothetical protein